MAGAQLPGRGAEGRRSPGRSARPGCADEEKGGGVRYEVTRPFASLASAVSRDIARKYFLR
jgi:hypothetical protein